MAKARVVITATNEMQKGLNSSKRQLTEFQSYVVGVGKQIQNSLNIAASVAAIVAAFKIATDAAKKCIDAYSEVEKVTKRVEAVWVNVGQATGKTAQQITEYADSLEKVTYFSDESIKEAALLLAATESLTEDGFDRALEASLDLAAALGEDVTSAAQTLAKAIQEPESALSRLKTIGVSFTEDEKNRIKALADANQQYEAQSLILDKIEQKYKGVARAINDTPVGTLDNIRDTISDIRENIGGALVNSISPVLESIFGWLTKISEWVAQWTTSTSVISKLQSGSSDLTSFNASELELALRSVNDALSSNNAEFKAHAASYERYKKILEDEIAYRKTLGAIITPTVTGGGTPAATATGTTMADFLKSVGSASSAYVNAGYQQVIDSAQEMLDKLTQAVPASKAELRELLGLDENASGADIKDAISKGNYVQILGQIIDTYTGKLNPKEEIGKTELELILDQYGKQSNSYQAKILQEAYSRISKEFNNPEISDEQREYLREILDGIDSQYRELVLQEKTEEKALGFLQNIQNKLTEQIAALFNVSNEEAGGFLGSVFGSFTSNMGEAGEVISTLAQNMATMGPLLGAIATALKYVLEGFGQVLGPVLNDFIAYGIEPLRELGRTIGEIVLPILQDIMPLVAESGRIIAGIFNELGVILQPIISFISSMLIPIIQQLTMTLEVLEPILKLIGGAIITVSTAFEWAGQWVRHIFASIANWFASLEIMGWRPFAGMETEDPGAPEAFGTMWQKNIDKMNQGYEQGSIVNAASTETAVSSASYRGATSVTINIYQEAPVVGDSGMRQFAAMIREEFEALDYYGVTA